MRIFLNSGIVILLAVLLLSCGKKENQQSGSAPGNSRLFSWKENVSLNDIPDSPVKGFINGKEVKIDYINYEIWRGSNDNVLNFSDKQPKNKCGFIEKDNAFSLTYTAGEFKEGVFLKESFSKNTGSQSADFRYTIGEDEKKVSVNWNCAMVITEKTDDYVKGKIAMCFKDDSKSWIAGSFTALRCSN